VPDHLRFFFSGDEFKSLSVHEFQPEEDIFPIKSSINHCSNHNKKGGSKAAFSFICRSAPV